MFKKVFFLLSLYSVIFCQAQNLSAKTQNAQNLKRLIDQSSRLYPQQGVAAPTPTILTTYYIGQYAQGGVVVYLTKDKLHGLVASIYNVGNIFQPGIGNLSPWALTPYTATGAIFNNPLPLMYKPGTTPKENYSGYNNQLLVENLDDFKQNPENYPAFQAAINHVEDGYNDWFVPSPLELQQIYLHRGAVNLASGYSGGDLLYADPISSRYWSSQEQASNKVNAGFIEFTQQGVEIFYLKGFPFGLRLVRAF